MLVICITVYRLVKSNDLSVHRTVMLWVKYELGHSRFYKITCAPSQESDPGLPTEYPAKTLIKQRVCAGST